MVKKVQKTGKKERVKIPVKRFLFSRIGRESWR
jgi:hypothetical protein